MGGGGGSVNLAHCINIATCDRLKAYSVKFLFLEIGYSLILECRGHGIM